jgi:subtilisin family serine protease
MSLAKSFVGGTTMDVQKHGTHVSGTIASYGEVSGVMQNASIIPVKVLGDNGSGSMYGIQQGILYAASIKADVINMSLGGGGYSQGMDEACQTAVNAGVVVVAAAGNSGTNVISYPAAYNSVIAVGSVDKNRRRANSSQYGAGLSVMAPGVGIYSTVPNNGYDTFSGTSMATPHVAGVAGLIRSVNKNLTPAEVRNILQTTAVSAGPTNEYGYGIVDAYAAVKAAGGDIVDPPTEYAIKTSMTTNKEIYNRGDSILTTATVLDQDGAPLENAKVVITLTRPNGTSVSTTQTTGASGVVSSIHGSSANTALGTFRITVVATLENYTSSTSTKTIKFVK